MTFIADTGVDERRVSRLPEEQIRVVPPAGHRAGVVGLEENRDHL